MTAADRMRAQVKLWRDGVRILQAGVADSPSHDLKRLINERVEAITICANELESLANDEPAP
jgi:hypothetical protein